MIKFGISKDREQDYFKAINNELLISEYNSGKSIKEISVEYGIKDTSGLVERLRKLGVQIRSINGVTEGELHRFDRSLTGYGDISGQYWSSVRNGACNRGV
jgi:hypothetical protein